MIDVVVVEDHPVFRDGLVALITAQPDMRVGAAVADGGEAVRIIAERRPRVVVMDLNLPTMSGIDATVAVMAEPDAPAVLVITMMDDDNTVFAALKAGARGYVLKDATGDEIAAAIRTVAGGGAVFGAGVATRVLAARTRPTAGGLDPLASFTEREREVLGRLAAGASNGQIARGLHLSLKTVQNHVSRILDKLQVEDRTQAALRARSLLDE